MQTLPPGPSVALHGARKRARGVPKQKHAESIGKDRRRRVDEGREEE